MTRWRGAAVPEIVKRRSAKHGGRCPRIPQPPSHQVRIPDTRKNALQIHRARAAEVRLAHISLRPVVVELRYGPFQRLQYTVPRTMKIERREKLLPASFEVSIYGRLLLK